MLVIVDYGLGNLFSVENALRAVGVEARISGRVEDVLAASKLVLPGVGAFAAGMAELARRGLVEPLHEQVVRRGRPVLGICLGMQLFAALGHEGGEHPGLGWIEDSEVQRMEPDDPRLKVPHVGWNDVAHDGSCPLFAGLPPSPEFYFTHSYSFRCAPAYVSSTFEYGGRFTASVRKGNVFGTQFHPEKSQGHGLRVLRNFAATE